MQEYSIFVLAQWLYDKYLMVFILCFLGSYLKDTIDTMKSLSKINIRKILVSTIFCSVIDTAILDYFCVTFSVYVLICFFTGLWSFKIMEYATNWKFILRFVTYLVKSFTGVVWKSFYETLDDFDSDGNLKADSTDKRQEDDSDKKT